MMGRLPSFRDKAQESAFVQALVERGPKARKRVVAPKSDLRAGLLFLQRYAGNQATQRLAGRPLEGGVKGRMEAAYGRDFSDVRVHTDADSSALANAEGARALTVGSDVVFNHDHYRPGTPVGDALIAHELAHVVQQRGAPPASSLSSAPDAALERDADRSALGAISSFWHGTKTMAGELAQSAGPRLSTGLRLQRCSKSTEMTPPAFLGEHSRATFDTIKRRAESAEALQDMLVVGPLLVLFTSSPLETAAGGGYPLEEQARAVAAVPVILRNRVLQDIDLLMLQHGNELTDEEKAYWQRIRNAFSR